MLDLSRKNPFYSLLQEATLLSAIEIFACGTHRGKISALGVKIWYLYSCSIVSVLKPDGEIQGILSQSTVVRYLFENRKQFPEIDQILDKSVSLIYKTLCLSDLNVTYRLNN